MDTAALYSDVDELGQSLRDVRLRLETSGAAPARSALGELVGQIDDYLLPRLAQMDAPLLAVVGGSTGAGKSTLVNSLIGREVSPSGVLRPTTTTPVLVANPGDLSWFTTDRILPDLPRTTGAPKQGAAGLFLVPDADVPPGLALLDAPDIDSVVAANRELANQLLAAGDLWMFVTTAARYADAVPWELLRKARSRSTALAVVLNRVPEEALGEVPAHLADMLRREGLPDTPVLVVPESTLAGGLVPGEALAPVRGWLEGLAADAAARSEVIRRTLHGALGSLGERVEIVASEMETQRDAAKELAAIALSSYDAAFREIERGLSSTPILRGEVLARWYEFIGTGDVMRSIQSAIGRFRDRVSDALLGRPPVEAEVREAVGDSIETLVMAAADRGLEDTLAGWRATTHGRALVAAGSVPQRTSPELPQLLDQQVRAWQGYVLELVAKQGAGKRAAGRAVSIGVNAVGAALMVVVFAHTGGLTGGEVAIAGGTAAASQRLLEALFGDQAVRDLTTAARSDLMRRLRALLQSEMDRFDDPLQNAAPEENEPSGLRDLARRIATAAA